MYHSDTPMRRLLLLCCNHIAVLLMFILLLFALTILLAWPAHAAQTTPYKINYQGRLTNSAGTPMPDGSYNMRFRIADAASGGNILWLETRDTTNRVVVTNGIFNVQLGDITPLSPSTTYPLYFEVELPTPATATCSTGGCASWTEGAIAPRAPMGSSLAAMNADTIDGIDGAALAQLGTAQTFTGNNTFSGTFTYQPASDSATAFRILNSTGAALLVADTTSSFALKVGGGNVSPDSTPALLVLDYKNTAGDPTVIDGAMYYNSVNGRFRCGESGVWKDCTNGVQVKYEMHNDMVFSANQSLNEAVNLLDGGLAVRLGSNGGSITRQASELNHPGIVRFAAGSFTITSNLAAMTSSLNTSSVNQIMFGGGVMMSNVMLRIPSANLSDATNTYTTYNGFLDGTTTTNIAPSNGCYLKYSHGNNNGKWQGVCRAAGVETANSVCDTTMTVAVSTWYNLSVIVNAAGTLATFAVTDGAGTTSICTANDKIPTATPVSLSLGFTRSAGSNVKSIDYDYAEFIGEALSR